MNIKVVSVEPTLVKVYQVYVTRNDDGTHGLDTSSTLLSMYRAFFVNKACKCCYYMLWSLTIPEKARQMMSIVMFVDAPQRAEPIRKEISANNNIGFLPKISDSRP
jgi:hypothetical protein